MAFFAVVLGALGASLVTMTWSAMGVAIWISNRPQARPSASANAPPSAAPTAGAPAGDPNDAKALDETYGIDAAAACDQSSDDYIRNAGAPGVEWDRSRLGFLGAKFDKYQTVVSQPGVITLITDKLTMKNSATPYTRVTLSCRYSTQSRKVLGYQIQQ